jgi:glycosyltransferase involved in cell wall biosynthesis
MDGPVRARAQPVMKRFGSIFPFLEQGPRHPHIGRLVANATFARALVEHGAFDEFVFGSPSRANLREFEEAARSWGPSGRRVTIRCADFTEWPAILQRERFEIMHLGGWGYFMPGLHYLRTQLAPALWPITGVIHSLHGRDTIDHAVRLVAAGMLPCDAVICTSRDGRVALQRLLDGAAQITGRRFRGQLLHAPLGVPDALLDEAGDRARGRQRLRIPEDARVVLVLGRLSVSQKMDPAPLCRAFSQGVLPRAGSNVVLVFAGGASQSELDLLRDTVHRLGLDAHVRLQANFAPDHKRDVLAMADIVVAPSDNVQETFGISILEAHAAGLPVVASRYDGYKDLVEDGVDGFLVDTWQAPQDLLGDWFDVMDGTAAQLLAAQSVAIDLEQLADRLVRLLASEADRRRMGEAGRRKVAREYRWSRVIARYEEIWTALSEQAAQTPHPGPLPNPFALGPATVFPHYTSHSLASDSMLVRCGTALDLLPYREAAGWLQPALLERLLRLAQQPVPAGRLVDGAGVPAPTAWFAVAWLLKYGMLRLATPPAAGPQFSSSEFSN